MLICFGLGYSAEHFVDMFGRRIRAHRRHRAQRRARRRVERASRGAAEGADLRRHARRRRTCAAPLPRPMLALVSVPPDENGDPVLARLRRCFGSCATAARRSSISRPSAFMATAAAPGSTKTTPPQPGSARSRERLAAERPGRISARAAASPSPSCGSPAFTDPDRTRWSRSRAATPAASSSRARSSTASMSATSRKRSMPHSRAGPPEFSTSPTTSRRRRPIRSSLPRSSWASTPPPEIPFDEAAPSMSPMALSFWQECRRVKNDKLKRELGVSLRYPTYREGLRALFEER